MKLYQLVARGALLRLGSSHRIHSRLVFEKLEDAVAHKSDFRKKVTTPMSDYDLYVLEEPVEIKVVELELKEGIV